MHKKHKDVGGDLLGRNNEAAYTNTTNIDDNAREEDDKIEGLEKEVFT